MSRFLILSASAGNGHTSASNALREALEKRGEEALVIDCMDHVSPMFRKWFKGGYESLVRRQPKLWGYLYQTSDRPLFNYQTQTFLDFNCCKPIDSLVQTYRPDVIVCAHSVAQPRLPLLRKELGYKVAVVVTDLHPHRMWLRGDPDVFFVPTEASKATLTARLGDRQKPIFVTGIPVNVAFSERASRETVCEAWGFDPAKPLILLSSGGIGAGPFDEALATLSEFDAQTIALCGRADDTVARLKARYQDAPNVRVSGQVSQETMGQLMSVADLLVGKSGGLTTFEALACGCPFAVLWPFLIPGQEEDNAHWLEAVGAGTIVKTMTDFQPTVERLLREPKDLQAMRHAAETVATPHAADHIVDELVKLVGDRGRVETSSS